MGEVLHIEDALNEKGVYVSTTSGVSMYPMLRNPSPAVKLVSHSLHIYFISITIKAN